MDPAVGLIICILILAVAVKLFWQSLNKMIDQSCDCLLYTSRCV